MLVSIHLPTSLPFSPPVGLRLQLPLLIACLTRENAFQSYACLFVSLHFAHRLILVGGLYTGKPVCLPVEVGWGLSS